MKPDNPDVIIIGGGFGGLQSAKMLAGKGVNVTLIDRKNHHTFQPLLYQVATAVLSPGEIASPIRRILFRAKNIEVVLGEVVQIDPEANNVKLKGGNILSFDYLITAAGARHSYFGHDEWEEFAPGLKTIEDAIEIRRRVLLAFELAEREAILTGTHQPLNFVVVGGGPTGVELAGAIAGIARVALAGDFKAIDTREARVMLLEGSDRILAGFSSDLSDRAVRDLEELGVEVRLNSFVTDVALGKVKIGEDWIETTVAVWATGVSASGLGRDLQLETDSVGRVHVNNDLSVPGHENIFVIGDMARIEQSDGQVVPGVAPAAIQMANSAVKNILADLEGRQRTPFQYRDKGSMATIGRSRAIVESGRIKMTGFLAWMAWLFVHVLLLIGFRNRLSVVSEWFWAYLTRERSARLITGGSIENESSLRISTRPAKLTDTMDSKPNRDK